MSQGLEGVVAAETALSMVDGERGELIIVGFPIEELAPNATFEETVRLLWNGDLPDVSNRELSKIAFEILRAAADRRDDPMDALRAAAGVLLPDQLFPAFPTIVAGYWRILHGQKPIAPRRELSLHAQRRASVERTRPGAGNVSQYDRGPRPERVHVYGACDHLHRFGPCFGDRRCGR